MKLSATGLMIGVFGLSSLALADKAAAPGGADHEIKMMDTDGDGKISAAEHAAGARKMFEMMDADKDGKVTAKEMEAAHERVTGNKAMKGEKSAAEKIRMIDTNGDGVITAEEHEEAARRMFEAMDTDKDGYLTRDEIVAGHAQMMRKAGK
jgi:Ca2+-binding EF-hand superfamily protein